MYNNCASKKEGTYKCNTTTSAHLLYLYATRRGDFNAWRGNSIYTQLLSCCDGLFDQWNLRAPTIQAPILSLIKKNKIVIFTSFVIIAISARVIILVIFVSLLNFSILSKAIFDNIKHIEHTNHIQRKFYWANMVKRVWFILNRSMHVKYNSQTNRVSLHITKLTKSFSNSTNSSILYRWISTDFVLR